MFVEANPQMRPAFENSVIAVGNNEPPTFSERSYQPKPFWPPQSFMKPSMFVEPAKSAEAATTIGRPYFLRPTLFMYAATFDNPLRLGCISPGLKNISSGNCAGSVKAASWYGSSAPKRKPSMSANAGTLSPNSTKRFAKYSQKAPSSSNDITSCKLVAVCALNSSAVSGLP